ncbi:MAG: potassium transporter Kup [Blastocatellia bacterium]|nr:potassium transporter Kup [Blastocatellia bacterium]
MSEEKTAKAVTETPASFADPRGRYLFILSLTALGVVYGDIGTSPLYAIRECFYGSHAIAVTRENVLGVLSLIFWSLIIVISIKYLVFILRADNRGEGGILALAALVTPVRASAQAARWLLILLGLFGAALLYGDGMITPAISVLSAVEGLEVATPFFRPYVIPLTVVIIIGLFLFQRRGTAGVGVIFGPITLVWFITLAAFGIYHIAQEPGVLTAVSPLHGLDFFLRNKLQGFLVLGAVFLVVTGGEALYADIGHFGIRPIRLTWFVLVLPALLLNYFGQGALLIATPSAAVNPFYQMLPRWSLYPMVILATAATVIASQAVISGAFSLTRQAVQLGYSPRLRIEHTSPTEIGQIYIPVINWGLMLACIGLVLGFRSSSNLAAAYGVAVTTTMVITTLLFYVVARKKWRWNALALLALCGGFLVIDLSFFGANILKITHGGWFPLVIAAIVFTIMSTWKTGRRILAERLRTSSLPMKTFIDEVEKQSPVRVPGTAIFMYSNPAGTPPALVNNLKYNKVLHERNLILTVETEEIPHVSAEDRLEVVHIKDEFYRIVAHYGFMQDPNIPEVLESLNASGLEIKLDETVFFVSRERLLATEKPGMAIWREKLFIWMSRNARGATSFFSIPADRVVELGIQIEL